MFSFTLPQMNCKVFYIKTKCLVSRIILLMLYSKMKHKTCLGRFQDCGRGKSKYPLWSEWTLWAQGWGEPSKIKLCLVNPLPGATFVLLAPAQFSKLIPPFCGEDPVGPGVRWATQNKALLCKPTRGATFVCWLLLNCLSYYPHLVGWTLQAQGWSEPPQI